MELQHVFLNACAEGDLKKAQTLLPRLAGVDMRSEQGWTGLIMACHGQHQDVAKWLIREGADVNATNHKGTTVFMYAKTPVVGSGDTSFLDFLISQGADPNAKDSFGKTALDYVVESHPNNRLVTYLSKQLIHRHHGLH